MAKLLLEEQFHGQQSHSEELAKQYGAVMQPLLEQKRMLDSLISPSIREAMRMSEDFANKYRITEGMAMPLSVREAIAGNALFAEQKRLSERVTEMMSPLAHAKSTTSLIASEIGRIAGMSSATADAIRGFEWSMKPAAEQALRAFEQIGQAPSAARALSELERLATTPSWSALDSVRQLVMGVHPSTARSALQTAMTELERLSLGAMAGVPSGVTVTPDLVAVADINEELATAFAFTDGSNDERLSVFLDQVLAIVRQAPKPIAKALLAVVCFVLLTILQGEIQYYSGALLAPTRRAVLNNARTRVRQTVPWEEQRALRIVTANNHLNVRRNPRRFDSAILGDLRYGTVVVAVREQKDWTLVEYVADDAEIRGWAYTRYLQPIAVPGAK